MSDDLRSINGLAAQVGRYSDVRPAQRVQLDSKQKHDADEEEKYRPLEHEDESDEEDDQGRPGRDQEDSGDELLSPLAQELDRLRLIGEHPDKDTLKALRGGRHYRKHPD